MNDHTPMKASRRAGPVPDEAVAGPRLYGVVDVIRANRVAGWVIDRSDPDAHAEVEVRREGRLIATIAANRPRKDLQRGGVGTGNYGFSVPLDPGLEPGMEFTITVSARSRDGVEVPLQPSARYAAAGAPEQKLLERIFRELVDLRSDIAAARSDEKERRDRSAGTLERMEVIQARLEAAIADVDLPAPRPARAIWILAAAGGLLGAGSLALGLLSLWGN